MTMVGALFGFRQIRRTQSGHTPLLGEMPRETLKAKNRSTDSAKGACQIWRYEKIGRVKSNKGKEG